VSKGFSVLQLQVLGSHYLPQLCRVLHHFEAERELMHPTLDQNEDTETDRNPHPWAMRKLSRKVIKESVEN